MTDPVTSLARWLALRKRASKAPTHIIPLEDVHKVVVFLDTADPDTDLAKKQIKIFFDRLGAEVVFLAPRKWEVNLFGWMKNISKLGLRDLDEDLFISLADSYNFAAEYAARCSRATFKVGHEQLKGGVFDLVVSKREHILPRQGEIFEAMTEYLLKITK